MDQLKQTLDPLIELLPDKARAYWQVIFTAAAVVILLVILLVLRALWRSLFRRKEQPADWNREWTEDLGAYPPPERSWGERWPTVYHVPVRLRLVVLAPAGTESAVDATAVERLLDQLVPGLGDVARHDRPRIRVWPPQMSHHGFAAAFYRRTLVPDPEGQPSRWVLVAGRAQVGRKPVLLGLALWADQPHTMGRIELEPYQWLDVVRLKSREG
ncbi:MAG TPA: hypothetical protein VG013_05080 [Gemmataceae bacterium]|jgi:hypothetical protein|nr:hypothetical protein [Gemmataceae bacterium]